MILLLATSVALHAASPKPGPADAVRPIPRAMPVRQVVVRDFDHVGDVLVSKGDHIVFESSHRPPVQRSANDWRWASITKQIVAVLVLQEVAAGRIDLDTPIAAYLPRFASPNAATITVRYLLRHQTGLPNPDDTAAAPDAVPAYYTTAFDARRDPLTGYCAGPIKGPAGANWAYNNCDYVVAGALLETVTGKRWPTLVRDRVARPLGLQSVGAFPTRVRTVAGTVDGRPEPAYDLAAFGASAGLHGTLRDLWAIDRALMTGRLLPDRQRAELWDGQPKLGSIALGQWVFNAPLKGCAGPVRIVERRGAIGGVEARNFILPDRDVVVIAFAARSGIAFGEVWQGRGFAYDLLSAAACQTS